MKFTKEVVAATLILTCIDIVHAQSIATTSPAPHPLELYANPQRLVTLHNGRKMNILCTGSGSPTVLLETGAGFSNWIWTPVQRRVARTNRVCSYDRAGFGFSDFASEPRTPANIATDLTSLLKSADIEGPYVMAAHSAGALYVRAFTDKHRNEIVGMVLVEPVSLDQDKRFEAEIPGDAQRHAETERFVESCAVAADSGALQRPSLPDSLRPCLAPPDASFPTSFQDTYKRTRESSAFFRTRLSENRGESATRLASEAGSYGDMPLIVLTARNSEDHSGYSADELAKFKKIWNSMHDEIAALSSRGVHRQIPGASHNLVLIEKPDVIAGAISEVLAAGAK